MRAIVDQLYAEDCPLDTLVTTDSNATVATWLEEELANRPAPPKASLMPIAPLLAAWLRASALHPRFPPRVELHAYHCTYAMKTETDSKCEHIDRSLNSSTPPEYHYRFLAKRAGTQKGLARCATHETFRNLF